MPYGNIRTSASQVRTSVSCVDGSRMIGASIASACVNRPLGTPSEETMLEALAKNWGWLLLRAILAAAYAVTALAWPDITLSGFVYLFGLYAIVDGMIALA